MKKYKINFLIISAIFFVSVVSHGETGKSKEQKTVSVESIKILPLAERYEALLKMSPSDRLKVPHVIREETFKYMKTQEPKSKWGRIKAQLALYGKQTEADKKVSALNVELVKINRKLESPQTEAKRKKLEKEKKREIKGA